MAADIRRLFGETKAADQPSFTWVRESAAARRSDAALAIDVDFGLAHGLGFATDLKEQLACIRP